MNALSTYSAADFKPSQQKEDGAWLDAGPAWKPQGGLEGRGHLERSPWGCRALTKDTGLMRQALRRSNIKPSCPGSHTEDQADRPAPQICWASALCPRTPAGESRTAGPKYSFCSLPFLAWHRKVTVLYKNAANLCVRGYLVSRI